jgi:hypothetical protein
MSSIYYNGKKDLKKMTYNDITNELSTFYRGVRILNGSIGDNRIQVGNSQLNVYMTSNNRTNNPSSAVDIVKENTNIYIGGTTDNNRMSLITPNSIVKPILRYVLLSGSYNPNNGFERPSDVEELEKVSPQNYYQSNNIQGAIVLLQGGGGGGGAGISMPNPSGTSGSQYYKQTGSSGGGAGATALLAIKDINRYTISVGFRGAGGNTLLSSENPEDDAMLGYSKAAGMNGSNVKLYKNNDDYFYCLGGIGGQNASLGLTWLFNGFGDSSRDGTSVAAPGLSGYIENNADTSNVAILYSTKKGNGRYFDHTVKGADNSRKWRGKITQITNTYNDVFPSYPTVYNRHRIKIQLLQGSLDNISLGDMIIDFENSPLSIDYGEQLNYLDPLYGNTFYSPINRNWLKLGGNLTDPETFGLKQYVRVTEKITSESSFWIDDVDNHGTLFNTSMVNREFYFSVHKHSDSPINGNGGEGGIRIQVSNPQGIPLFNQGTVSTVFSKPSFSTFGMLLSNVTDTEEFMKNTQDDNNNFDIFSPGNRTGGVKNTQYTSSSQFQLLGGGGGSSIFGIGGTANVNNRHTGVSPNTSGGIGAGGGGSNASNVENDHTNLRSGGDGGNGFIAVFY